MSVVWHLSLHTEDLVTLIHNYFPKLSCNVSGGLPSFISTMKF